MAIRHAFTGSNSSTIKLHNLSTVLLALLQHKHISRAQLAKLTGLSNTTITNIIVELLAQGIAVEEGTSQLQRRPGAGRPRTALRLNPEARYAVGIHIGVGHIRIALTNLLGTVISSYAFNHPLDKSAEEVLSQTSQSVAGLIDESGITPQAIIGIGVGASGLVNSETGINVKAPNLGWDNVPIRERLERQLNLPVTVDNNVRAMALGEALFGAAQDVRVLAFMYARYGVGAGFVVNGQLYRGSGAGAGEIGHTTITPDGGEMCRCGNRGCLEPLVSEPNIVNRAKYLAQKNSRGLLAAHLNAVQNPGIEEVFAAARAGDEDTRQMLVERARYMGIALANLVNVLNPEVILLGGLYFQGQDLLIPTVEATVRQRSFGNLGEHVKIRATSFGQHAGIIGAAALALTTFFYRQQQYRPFSLPEKV